MKCTCGIEVEEVDMRIEYILRPENRGGMKRVHAGGISQVEHGVKREGEMLEWQSCSICSDSANCNAMLHVHSLISFFPF